MNPLTLVKRTQKINSKEADLGISEEASWHAKYKDSAYVFVGGIPYDLTEGDLVAVFAQYGEVVDVNLVRDKSTGKSKGFAFLAYEDQRSTILAVDNLNGAKVLGRIVRVDHVSKYKKKEEEEDDEEAQQKREARGVCRAFQRGECTRGASCKFSHDEHRSANTGWGPQDTDSQWNRDKNASLPPKSRKTFSRDASDKTLLVKNEEDKFDNRFSDRGVRSSRLVTGEDYSSGQRNRNESRPQDQERHRSEKITETRPESRQAEDLDIRTSDKSRSRHKSERNREDLDRRGDEKRSRHDDDSSRRHTEQDDRYRRSRR